MGDARPRAGVDEAGRGPVLGPLVVAGVLVPDERQLRKLGVKDSKKLAPAKREALDREIRAVATAVAVRVVEPGDLDLAMSRASLNVVEMEIFADVLRELAPPLAYVDAADVDEKRFGDGVRSRLAFPCEVIATHKADERFPCVSAASIVAKVERDRRVRLLADDLGCDVGSGYCHDRTTMTFLETWVREHGALPTFARHRWMPAQRLLQRPLTEYAGVARE